MNNETITEQDVVLQKESVKKDGSFYNVIEQTEGISIAATKQNVLGSLNLGKPGYSTGHLTFSVEDFNPYWMPSYVKIRLYDDKISMSSYYCPDHFFEKLGKEAIIKDFLYLSDEKNILSVLAIGYEYWIVRGSNGKGVIICISIDTMQS